MAKSQKMERPVKEVPREGVVERSDIDQRAFEFALRIIGLTNLLPGTVAGKVFAHQLARSGTSIGANIEEARGGFSKNDFAYKMSIALREARESNYWLRLIEGSGLIKPDIIAPLLKESGEIKNILGAIVSKARGKRT